MILSEAPRIELLNMDCMEFMARCRDKQFSLAIVDPPYGIGNFWMKSKKTYRYGKKSWNNKRLNENYFLELFRISENQIIWGANYYCHFLPERNSWLIWDKNRNADKTFMSEAELAWTSFNDVMRIIKITWDGIRKAGSHDNSIVNIHPNQRPIQLYEWQFERYANAGDSILDTHGGSFSSAIAAYRLGFDFVGTEKDFDYYTAAVKRFKEQTVQMQLFKPEPKPEPVQLSFGDKLCPNCNRHHSEAGEFCCTACEFGI